MNKLIISGVVLVILLILGLWLAPFTTVDAGHKGVVLRWGNLDRVIEPGFNYISPIGESVEQVDVRTQKEEVESTAASKDLQNVSAKIAVNFNVQADRVAELWKNIGPDYKSKVIDPTIQEAIKASTAKHTAEELVTKREVVKDEIKAIVRERLAGQYLTVTEVAITNFDFSRSFNSAIEAKVTAEQDALASKNKLEQVKFEAQQQIEKAKAEAQNIRLQSDAANNDKYIQLKQLEVQLEFAKKWNGVYPQYYVTGGGVTAPIIPLPTGK